MKTRQILMSFAVIGMLFILSSQAAAASQTVETKGTPPGLVKTPAQRLLKKLKKPRGPRLDWYKHPGRWRLKKQ